MLLAMLAIYRLSVRVPTLTIVMTPKIAAYLFALTMGMCIFAAITAIESDASIRQASSTDRSPPASRRKRTRDRKPAFRISHWDRRWEFNTPRQVPL